MKNFLSVIVAVLSTWSSVNAEPALTVLYSDQRYEFTIEELSAMEQVSFTTGNDFIDEPATFSGPSLLSVLQLTGLDELDKVSLTAINNYSVDIPYSDYTSFDVILAIRMNGEYFSIRERGPIWLMYPISDHPELLESVYSSRLIWQVTRITE